jgi:hypothetical protein
MSETHRLKEPQELRYVVEAFARYSKTNPGEEVKVKRGPLGIFGTVTRNETYSEVGGSTGANAGGTLDVSTVPEVLASVEELRSQSEKWVSRMLDNPPKPGFLYDSGIRVELWIGTPAQFEPRPSSSERLWSRQGELGAFRLAGAEITAANIERFIDGYNTPEKHLKTSIEAATAPVRDVKKMKVLQVRKGP